MEHKTIQNMLSVGTAFQLIADILGECPYGWNITYGTDGHSEPEFIVTGDYGYRLNAGIHVRMRCLEGDLSNLQYAVDDAQQEFLRKEREANEPTTNEIPEYNDPDELPF